jgi:hypothetical protein
MQRAVLVCGVYGRWHVFSCDVELLRDVRRELHG